LDHQAVEAYQLAFHLALAHHLLEEALQEHELLPHHPYVNAYQPCRLVACLLDPFLLEAYHLVLLVHHPLVLVRPLDLLEAYHLKVHHQLVLHPQIMDLVLLRRRPELHNQLHQV
jgi:hypothetical protein